MVEGYRTISTVEHIACGLMANDNSQDVRYSTETSPSISAIMQ